MGICLYINVFNTAWLRLYPRCVSNNLNEGRGLKSLRCIIKKGHEQVVGVMFWDWTVVDRSIPQVDLSVYWLQRGFCTLTHYPKGVANSALYSQEDVVPFLLGPDIGGVFDIV